MTQEKKQLLLKDLCARLPYGVKICACGNKEYTAILKGVVGDEFFLQFDYQKTEVTKKADTYNIKEIKPYLRPLSSMTDEEKMYVNELIYDKDGLFLSPIPTWVINECDIDKYIDFCNSKHLDWCGLISKGLALPAPEGMYNAFTDTSTQSSNNCNKIVMDL